MEAPIKEMVDRAIWDYINTTGYNPEVLYVHHLTLLDLEFELNKGRPPTYNQRMDELEYCGVKILPLPEGLVVIPITDDWKRQSEYRLVCPTIPKTPRIP